MMDEIQKRLLAEVADLHGVSGGSLQHPCKRSDWQPETQRQILILYPRQMSAVSTSISNRVL